MCDSPIYFYIAFERAIFYFLKMEDFCPEDYDLLVKKIKQMTENDLEKRRLFEKQFGYEMTQRAKYLKLRFSIKAGRHDS